MEINFAPLLLLRMYEHFWRYLPLLLFARVNVIPVIFCLTVSHALLSNLHLSLKLRRGIAAKMKRAWLAFLLLWCFHSNWAVAQSPELVFGIVGTNGSDVTVPANSQMQASSTEDQAF